MIEIFQSIVNKIKKNILWIVLFSGIIGTIYSFIAYKQETKFKSYSKIFPLTADGGDPLSSMKAQFGLSTPGNLSKYYNVNELVGSKNISRQIVMYPSNYATYYKENKTLYDWIIEDYNKCQYLSKDKIKFDKDTFQRIITASELMKSMTMVKVEKSEFTSIECTSGDENLSLRLNECILKCLSDFYITSKTEKARTDLNRIGLLKDSLKGSLDYLERAMAGFSDESRYNISQVANLPKVKLERMHEEISEQYKTTAIAFQNANFKLLSESPIFQVLDKPVGPTETIKASWKKAFILPFIASFLLLCIFAIRKIIIQLVMAELNAK
jgi:hypothetical protein